MRLTVILVVNLLLFPLFVPGQSGRTVSTPKVSTPISEPAKVFPSCENGDDQLLELVELPLEEFSEKLNDNGNCGYRLVSATRELYCRVRDFSEMKVNGVIELDAGNKYEYGWFIAYSPGEAQRLLNAYAEKGFYFRQKMSFVSGRCHDVAEAEKGENSTLGGLGSIFNESLGKKGAIFLMERKNGLVKKNEYRILDGRLSGERGELEENKKILDNFVAKGFRPVDLWYLNFTTQNVLIMEKDEAVKPIGEYIFIYRTTRLNKKLTELGREGYQPIHIGFVFALLQKTNNQPTGMTYDSIETWEEIEKRLPKWKQSGIKYIDIGTSGYFMAYDPFDGRWLFAVPNKDGAANKERKDFLFLHRSDFIRAYIKKNNLKVNEKNPFTKEQFQEINMLFGKEMNRIAKEGYKLVNYGQATSPILLFERAND